MTINLDVPASELREMKPKLTVIGVGGAGSNAVNNMIRAELQGVEFVVANTDAQSLSYAETDRRVQLGGSLTQGLGAGARPDVGRAAAEESMDDIIAQLKGTHMAFVAAGMGGGTGTGAAPVIARAARDLGLLTVGVVTKPFQFEGAHRMRIAEDGIKELEQYVDTLIVIPNQNLFRVANEKTTFADAFKMADDVLYSGVRGVTDLMVMPGLINLDFADVRSVMGEMGKAMMGTGEAEGERRSLDAAEAAISNPLLDDTSMKGAKGILINITGGNDMTLFEVDEAANHIRAEAGEDAYIIFGSTFEAELEGSIRVSVVATGIDAESMSRPKPRTLDLVGDAVASEASLPRVEIVGEPETVVMEKEEAPIAEAAPVSSPESLIVPPTAREESPESPIEAAIEAPIEAPDQTPAMAEMAAWDEAAPTEEAPVATEEAPAAAVAELDMSAPVAAPAEGAGDSFIPPAPMERTGQLAPTEAEPFAEADMINASTSPAGGQAGGQTTDRAFTKGSGARRPSLFSLATGSGRRAAKEAAEKDKAAVEARPAPEVVSETRQPELGSMNPSDRLAQSQGEEDLLDIPAFLRRQAN